MEPSHKTREPARHLSPMVWLGIIAGILIIGIFASIQYLKSSNDKTGATAASQSLGEGPVMNTARGGAPPDGEPCPNGQRKAVLMVGNDQVVTCGTPANSKVTNVTSNSITITDSSDGSSKTYAISSDTKIAKKGGVDVQLSEISIGENIGVIPNDDNTAARRVLADLPS